MIKGKEILGRNIVAISNGQKVETVHDIVFDHQANQVLGLLVEEGGWFRAAKVVPFDRIRSFGEHAIMIADPADVTSARDDSRLAEVLDSKVNLIGMALLTTDGQKLGRISDVYFDEQTGRVEGYDATGGLFADLSHGRTFVPAPDAVQIGADAAIVPVDVANAMREQGPGGVAGVFHGAATSVREGVQNVTEGVKDTYEVAAGSVREGVSGVTEAARGRSQDYVVGKRAGSEIVAEDGTVVIREGEVITPLHAEVAEWHGKLAALAASATTGSVAGAVQEATSSVRATVNTAAEAGQDRQKEFVIGKVAGADVTLDDGTPVVRRGETITAVQAATAERHGLLPAVTAAATGGTVGQTVTQVYTAATSRVREGVRDVQEAVTDRQRDFVVGKVAAREVTTGSGEVIVRAGESITAEQAEHAQREGKLTALMGVIAVDRAAAAPGPQAAIAETPASALGRRVKVDVRTSNGGIVAAQGQIVTPELLRRAEALGVSGELLQATGEGAGPAAGAGAAVAGGVASVTEGASQLLGKAKQWLSDRREETEAAISERAQGMEEERIRDALGRPVNRVVLAPDDSIILNVGEIVTNRAVDAARAGNVLDILLGSVSHEGAQVDPMATRPTEPGRASLESQPDLSKSAESDTGLL